ncbi:response regulator transcription factor [Ruminococcaceae bacterium OttesenSCG-928-I18]|nr:response regulator transcription factor [Ruminococcaceae bacterium OttesenSCG-928-I18]
MHKILLVEDDATIARLVAKELESWGFEVSQVEDFSAVMDCFHRVSPQLVLLDLSLPHRSGFHWCAEIRRESKVPILFLSSAQDNMNLVTALHQGADDFLTKPFDMPVLVAKVQALLRRSYDFAEAGDTLSFRGAVLDLGEMALRYEGAKIELTRNEFRIMQKLMENRGRVVSRDAIIRALWDDESFIDDNTLTVNINRLRKKLEAAGLQDYVATKKGEGYLIPSGE